MPDEYKVKLGCSVQEALQQCGREWVLQCLMSQADTGAVCVPIPDSDQCLVLVRNRAATALVVQAYLQAAYICLSGQKVKDKAALPAVLSAASASIARFVAQAETEGGFRWGKQDSAISDCPHTRAERVAHAVVASVRPRLAHRGGEERVKDQFTHKPTNNMATVRMSVANVDPSRAQVAFGERALPKLVGGSISGDKAFRETKPGVLGDISFPFLSSFRTASCRATSC